MLSQLDISMHCQNKYYQSFWYVQCFVMHLIVEHVLVFSCVNHAQLIVASIRHSVSMDQAYTSPRLFILLKEKGSLLKVLYKQIQNSCQTSLIFKKTVRKNVEPSYLLWTKDMEWLWQLGKSQNLCIDFRQHR